MLLGEYSRGTWQLYTRIPHAPCRMFLVLFCDLWKIDLVLYFHGIREEKKERGERRKSLRCQESIVYQTLSPSSPQNCHMNADIPASSFPLPSTAWSCLFFWLHLTFQDGNLWFSGLSMTLSIEIKLLDLSLSFLILLKLSSN